MDVIISNWQPKEKGQDLYSISSRPPTPSKDTWVDRAHMNRELSLPASRTAWRASTEFQLNCNDWPEFIVLDANTRLRCKEMLFLEFSDIDWNAGVLHVRNKTQAGFRPKGRKERRIPLNVPAMYALQSMPQKKHAKSDYVFHQADGLQWKSILESFRSLLKRCELKRSGVHILRHLS